MYRVSFFIVLSIVGVYLKYYISLLWAGGFALFIISNFLSIYKVEYLVSLNFC